MRDPFLPRKVRGEGNRQTSRCASPSPFFIAAEHDLRLFRVDGDSFDMPLEELTIRDLEADCFFCFTALQTSASTSGADTRAIEPALAFRFCSRACET
jgi:hypothetical protein